jgi:hypothetical protein
MFVSAVNQTPVIVDVIAETAAFEAIPIVAAQLEASRILIANMSVSPGWIPALG